MEAVVGQIMARKKSTNGETSKPSNEGKLVRLDPAIVAMGKAVAASRGQHLSDYLAELLRQPVGKDYAKMLRDLEAN